MKLPEIKFLPTLLVLSLLAVSGCSSASATESWTDQIQ